MRLRGQRVLVVGLARSGVAAARLLAREGARVTVTDRRSPQALASAVEALLPHGVRFELGGHDSDSFLRADRIVVSPGVPLTIPFLAKAREAGVPIHGEVELAAAFVEEPIVGVTGTNGKSTTTALLGHLLESAGREVFVGGNFGVALSERVLAGGRRDVSVVELSSFQLEGIERFRPDVAVLTNLSPDHLDRYPDAEAYYRAKAAIFRQQRAEDVAVLPAEDARALSLHEGAASRRRLFGAGGQGWDDDGALAFASGVLGEEGTRIEGLPPTLRGAHNRENALAASLAAAALGLDRAAIEGGLRSFRGLPHRLESVRTLAGVEWINDSKATNVDASAVALQAVDAPIVWIAGGVGKGAPYAGLLPLVASKVRVLLTIGEEAPALREAFAETVEVVDCGTLDVAVARAASLARVGDVVLLSPACASFDHFASFEERGERFRALVEGLR